MVAVITLLALALGAGCGPVLQPTDADGDGVLWTRDCDDGDPSIHPGAVETCDGRDEDCDGLVDEEVSVSAWYRDADGDGWGDSGERAYACAAPEGFVAEAGDCDDGDPERFPAAEEISCDDIDQDCDGLDGACRVLDPALACWGAATSDAAGLSLAGVGDFDGDGHDDFLVGAPTWVSYTTGPGAAMLVRGGPTPQGGALVDCALKLGGEVQGYAAGFSVSAAGDVNGDGLADLLVGAPEFGGLDALTGLVFLVLGSRAPTSMVLTDADAVFVGSAAEGGVGWTVAGGGDMDGDGLDDLLLGAHRDGVATGEAPVAAWVVSGAEALGGGAVDTVGVRLELEERPARVRATVAVVGDADGDGLADMLVGDPEFPAPSGPPGRVYLVLGETALGDRSLAEADAHFDGAECEAAGDALAGAGDVDSDGHDDLLIGAWWNCDAATLAGAVYVVLGTPELRDRALVDADAIYRGYAAYDRAGISVAGAGDVDGDGFADLLIGALGDSMGRLHLVLGGPSLSGSSLADSDLILRTGAASDEAGLAVAGAGDVDSDGVPDLLMGAPRADLGGVDAGAAYLVLGSTLW